MNAVTIKEYGTSNVLNYKTGLKVPSPNKNQVLIKVIATSVNPLDINIRKGKLKMILGSKFPIILGNDVSGIIIECGDGVSRYKVGDLVYCMVDSNTHKSVNGFAKSGTYAEYVVTHENTVAIKPKKITHNEAAAVPLCALTAYQSLVYRSGIKKGQSVIINGASGGVGIYATQIAIAFGAKVTAVCSKDNEINMRELGVKEVIDYKSANLIEVDTKYDIIYDVVANQSYKIMKSLLTEEGVYLSNIAPPIMFVLPFMRAIKRYSKYTYSWVYSSGKDLDIISRMIDQGEINPYIDKVFSLDNAHNAHEYFEKEKRFGKVIIEI